MLGGEEMPSWLHSQGSLRPGHIGAYADSSWADVQSLLESRKNVIIFCATMLWCTGG